MDQSFYTKTCRFCPNTENNYLICISDKIIENMNELTNCQLTLDVTNSNLICQKCLGNLDSALSIKRSFIESIQSSITIKTEVLDLDTNFPETIIMETFIKEEQEQEQSYKSEQSDQVLTNTKRKAKKGKKNRVTKKRITPKNLTCPDCHKVCKSKESYNNHIRWHEFKNTNPVRVYPRVVCTICGLELSEPSMYVHMRNIHERKSRLICDVCGRDFSRKPILLMHLRGCHFNIRPFECKICHKRYACKDHLKVHYKHTHEKNRDKVCHLCGKAFRIKSYLETHIRSKHTGEKPFVCEEMTEDDTVCGKTFFSIYEKRSHIKRQHNTSRVAEECSVCHGFYKNLQMHMNIHLEKFICDFVQDNGEVCGKAFISNHLKQKHIDMKHKQIKLFNCEHCQMPYRIKLDMNLHILNIHEGRKIKCELCNCLLGSRQYYRQHVRNSHSNLGPDQNEKWLKRISKMSLDELFNYKK